MISEDREIENMLARYRPAGPSASLRRRVLSLGRPRRSRWVIADWSAIAATLVICLGLHLATQQLLQQTAVCLREPQAARSSQIDEVAELLDGNNAGRRYIDFVLTADRPRIVQHSNEMPVDLLREIQ